MADSAAPAATSTRSLFEPVVDPGEVPHRPRFGPGAEAAATRSGNSNGPDPATSRTQRPTPTPATGQPAAQPATAQSATAPPAAGEPDAAAQPGSGDAPGGNAPGGTAPGGTAQGGGQQPGTGASGLPTRVRRSSNFETRRRGAEEFGSGNGPFGPGSAKPNQDGSAPSPEFRIKASPSAMLYHTPDSPYFGRTRADVWFRNPEDAERAGFMAWNRRND